MKQQRLLFGDDIIVAWWRIMEDCISGGAIKPGEDYLIIDHLLYVHFRSVYAAYLQRVYHYDLPREWLLSPPQMRALLCGQRDYLFDQRKRLSSEANVRTMVFAWNRQVRTPAQKLRKVG